MTVLKNKSHRYSEIRGMRDASVSIKNIVKGLTKTQQANIATNASKLFSRLDFSLTEILAMAYFTLESMTEEKTNKRILSKITRMGKSNKRRASSQLQTDAKIIEEGK